MARATFAVVHGHCTYKHALSECVQKTECAVPRRVGHTAQQQSSLQRWCAQAPPTQICSHLQQGPRFSTRRGIQPRRHTCKQRTSQHHKPTAAGSQTSERQQFGATDSQPPLLLLLLLLLRHLLPQPLLPLPLPLQLPLHWCSQPKHTSQYPYQQMQLTYHNS